MLELDKISFDLDTLSKSYRENIVTPVDVVREVYRRIRVQGERYIWVSIVPEDKAIENAQALMDADLKGLPLYGIPFSVKDNIHVKGLKTTASCDAFGFYPDDTATVVKKLLAAGAILIGKNTMDQFATGLVGIRSSGHPVNPFNTEYIPGGSSSGSAVAVSTGLVTFSLGSDTGGSGRIPAALNNIVGLKPTPGLISTYGMVYANRSFDCVPIFALKCNDAKAIFNLLVGFDKKDPFSLKKIPPKKNCLPVSKRLVVAIPDTKHLPFFGDELAKKAFDTSVGRLKTLDVDVVEIDFSPFMKAGEMIFNGPFLAERYASLEDFFKSNRADVNEVVGEVIDKAITYNAVDLCNEYYRLKALQTIVDEQFETINMLMVPTAGTIYTIKEVEDNPIVLNGNMGYYTYYANILKLSAIAMPAVIRSDGLPFGVCFLAKSLQDSLLTDFASRWESATDLPLGAVSKRNH